MNAKTDMVKGRYCKTCRYCGRTWWVDGGREVGFVVAAAGFHIELCRNRRPVDRCAQNTKDEKRWNSKPPRVAVIVNDPDHPGLSEEPAP